MIVFDNVQIKYNTFVAVDNLNLTIHRGEFFTFLGPSGCGKTTTLRSLAGFVEPSAGTISVNGKVINSMPIEKRKIGIVFQSYALFPTMSVYENIAFGLKVLKEPKEEVHRQVLAVAKKIALDEKQLSRNVAELSGGQQQRVALARAIVLRPEILCLDEPLSNLDAKLRVGLRGELKRLQRELGITTLYVTHDQEEALTLSDRIAVFNNGRIEQVGTPYEIYNQSASEFVCDFIGDINRLKAPLIMKINGQSNRKLLSDRDAFIRIERVHARRSETCDVMLAGRLTDREYNGIYTKYSFDIGGEALKSIEKNDGMHDLSIGQEIPLFLNSGDIMQF